MDAYSVIPNKQMSLFNKNLLLDDDYIDIYINNERKALREKDKYKESYIEKKLGLIREQMENEKECLKRDVDEMVAEFVKGKRRFGYIECDADGSILPERVKAWNTFRLLLERKGFTWEQSNKQQEYKERIKGWCTRHIVKIKIY